MPMKPNPVAIPSQRYEELRKKRALPRTLMGGTTAMRAAAQTYLPKYPAEPPKTYKTRLANTHLYPAFSDAVHKQASKFFREPIMLEGVPKPIEDILTKDIDGEGRALTPFGMDVVDAAMCDGVSFIFVDKDPLPVGATRADELRLNVQPKWILFTADQVIGWRHATINGKTTLTQLRVKQCTWEPAGEFGEVDVERVRVYNADGATPVVFQVWRKYKDETTGEEVWRIESDGVLALTYIPIEPFYTRRVGFMEGEPPLDGLADLSSEHWVSSSEQRNALTFLRFSMLVLIGMQPPKQIKKAPNLAQGEIGDEVEPKVEIGPAKVLYAPVGGDAKYVEHSGKGIESGTKDLEAIERRMQTTGIALRVENQGKVTATASALDSAETNATMKAMAKELKDTIERCIQITADWMKIANASLGEVKVYDEFGEVVTEVTLDQLLKMRMAREMSRETFWAELKRRGILSDDFDPAKEETLIAADEAKDMEKMMQTLEIQTAALPPEGGDKKGGKRVPPAKD